MPGSVVAAARARAGLCAAVAALAMAAAGSVAPAGAQTARDTSNEDTAQGTMLSLSDAIDVAGQDADGTTTTCAVYAGTLATAAGETINFAIGGVLSDGRLDPQTQAGVDALRAATARGAAAVATIVYEETGDLCGHPESNLVTSASYAIPPQTAAAPTPPSASPATPARGTASGRVTRISQTPALAGQAEPDGSTAFCDIWRGTLTTGRGRTIALAVQTALTTSGVQSLHPADPAAARTARSLLRAWADRAQTTVTYAGPVVACGESLARVVVGVAVKVAPPRRHRPAAVG